MIKPSEHLDCMYNCWSKHLGAYCEYCMDHLYQVFDAWLEILKEEGSKEFKTTSIYSQFRNSNIVYKVCTNYNMDTKGKSIV